jgi:hypothetical protein
LSKAAGWALTMAGNGSAYSFAAWQVRPTGSPDQRFQRRTLIRIGGTQEVMQNHNPPEQRDGRLAVILLVVPHSVDSQQGAESC